MRIPQPRRLTSPTAVLLVIVVPLALRLTHAARAEVEILKPVGALPAHIAGAFHDLSACQQSASGEYFIFDRRAHSVYTYQPKAEQARKLIEIGAEPGRLLDPSAFALTPDGTFVVADAPRNTPRIQIFMPSGSTMSGFFLQGRSVPRIVLKNLVLSGIGAIQFTGQSILLNQPELGALIVEYGTGGHTIRMFGELRRTGHETDASVHLALNSGLVIANPRGGFYFVFLAGVPQFRKYDGGGKLLFERHIEGPELDELIATLPQKWRRQRIEDGELPLILPSVYAAAADSKGNLWISLAVGTTYVYDETGEKRRAVQFRGAGMISPTGMSFAPNGRLLVTPGCFAFAAGG